MMQETILWLLLYNAEKLSIKLGVAQSLQRLGDLFWKMDSQSFGDAARLLSSREGDAGAAGDNKTHGRRRVTTKPS